MLNSQKAERMAAMSTDRWPAWLRIALSDLPGILQHTVALVFATISIWLVHAVVSLLLGYDAKFYGAIPIAWAFDTAHIAVLARFVWKLIKQIWQN